ncbi:MAG TPA: hypothetical protein VFA45_18375 [Actinomycetes bacterium]|jgi:predicted DNA-binding transcriptional regulator AlpA|nr:hypothetical protein [Actinomycetes bacterium]
MDRYLSATEVADLLAMSRSWVYKHKLALGGVQVGDRMWRFPENRIRAYLSSMDMARPNANRHAHLPARRMRQMWRLDY